MKPIDIMYRSSPEVKKPVEPFNSLLGLNSLDMKCFQEMYLETYASSDTSDSSSSPSISPSSSISTGTYERESISPDFMLSSNSPVLPSSSVEGGMMNIARGNQTDLQNQQLFAVNQQHQRQLLTATVAQQQLAMTTDAGGRRPTNLYYYTQQQQDEISKSLKMFAMLSAYSNENELSPIMSPKLPQSPVDEVMKDFACNGYACDELHRYQLGVHLSNNPALPAVLSTNPYNSANSQQQNTATAVVTSPSAAAAAISTLHQQQLQQLQQQNLNNFWKMLPSRMQKQHSQIANAAATTTAAAAVNIDYNSNHKKPKRYNSAKNEKYTSAKHCVFCENNNEAEAVVKSHAVRDSMGRVLCPKLRTYVCPICKASGDMAHTIKYCPQKPIITMEDALKAESFRLIKGTYYKQQMKV